MSGRRINAMLWVCAAALLALAGGVIVWTVMNPISREVVVQGGATVPTTNPASAGELPSLASVQAILDKPLRKNLTGEATGPDATSAAANPNDPPLTLVGTIGNSLAMLRMRDGKIELKGVGETVAGMTVLSISPSRIQVRYNGKLMSLDKTPRRG